MDFYYTVSTPLTEEVCDYDDRLTRIVRVIWSTTPEVIVTMNPERLKSVRPEMPSSRLQSRLTSSTASTASGVALPRTGTVQMLAVS